MTSLAFESADGGTAFLLIADWENLNLRLLAMSNLVSVAR